MENKINIEDLKPAEGATHRTKRKGRGRSSGMGKTSCRGHNGEGQRAGRSKKRGFEGGQMPGYRKVPKLKGFELVGRIKKAEINVGDLDKFEEEVINLELLQQKGIAHSTAKILRVLGSGEMKSAKTIQAGYFTESARTKIEAAGGKFEVV